MKLLLDGNKVSSRSYYYLLDFNDSNNKQYIAEKFNKHRLCDLTLSEFKELFNIAISLETFQSYTGKPKIDVNDPKAPWNLRKTPEEKY
jgi:hypothetical protein